MGKYFFTNLKKFFFKKRWGEGGVFGMNSPWLEIIIIFVSKQFNLFFFCLNSDFI